MDSREKIVSGVDARARIAQWVGADVQVISGCFDPLLAAHAERLASAKRNGAKVVVVLVEPAEPILATRARAELVAALRCVDLVVTDDGGGLVPELRFENEDASAAGQFVAHVLERMS